MSPDTVSPDTVSPDTVSHDALLILSFGGPEGPDDVLPFLRQVTRGRDVPDERLAIVAEQYHAFGGRSPINDQCRALIDALKQELAANKIDLPIYWGNRNWHPFVDATVAEMAADGIRDALVFVTSAFGSYSGCRQYREDLVQAAETVGVAAPKLSKLRLFYNHPGFIEPMAANLTEAIGDGRAGVADGSAQVVFTAHSIPEAMLAGCDYVSQLDDAAGLIMAAAGLSGADFDLVYQSRSGPPSVPWLEPDVNDHLTALADRGVDSVHLVPVGFISDHMEVMFDLDTQAAATAEKLGLALTRVSTVGIDPRFVTMIRELIEERTSGRARLSVGPAGPWPDLCPEGHCPAPRRRPVIR